MGYKIETHRHRQTDSSMVVTREKQAGGRLVNGTGGQIYEDER